MAQSKSKTLLADFPSVRSVAAATIVVSGVVLAFWLLLLFHETVLILLAALVLSTAVQIPVARLNERGMSRSQAILLVFIGVVAMLAGLLWALAPLVSDQVAVLGQELTAGYLSARQQLIDANNLLLQRLAQGLPPEPPLAMLFSMPETAVSADVEGEQVLNTAGSLLETVLKIGVALVLTFFWTREKTVVQQRFLLLLPIRHRERVRQLLGRIETSVGQYIIGQMFLSLLVGVVSLAAYLLIGLPYAGTLAIFAGLMEAIPLIGPWIGAVPAMVVAISISPASAIWVVIASIVIQQLENNLFVPRVMQRTVGVRPLVSILALLGLGLLFGVPGAFVAIPVAAVLQILLDDWLAHRDEQAQKEAGGRDIFSRLRYQTDLLVQDIRQHLRHKQDASDTTSDALEDEVEAIASELYLLIGQERREQS